MQTVADGDSDASGDGTLSFLPNGDATQEFHKSAVRFQPGGKHTRLSHITCGPDARLQARRLLVPALRAPLG